MSSCGWRPRPLGTVSATTWTETCWAVSRTVAAHDLQAWFTFRSPSQRRMDIRRPYGDQVTSSRRRGAVEPMGGTLIRIDRPGDSHKGSGVMTNGGLEVTA